MNLFIVFMFATAMCEPRVLLFGEKDHDAFKSVGRYLGKAAKNNTKLTYFAEGAFSQVSDGANNIEDPVLWTLQWVATVRWHLASYLENLRTISEELSLPGMGRLVLQNWEEIEGYEGIKKRRDNAVEKINYLADIIPDALDNISEEVCDNLDIKFWISNRFCTSLKKLKSQMTRKGRQTETWIRNMLELFDKTYHKFIEKFSDEELDPSGKYRKMMKMTEEKFKEVLGTFKFEAKFSSEFLKQKNLVVHLRSFAHAKNIAEGIKNSHADEPHTTKFIASIGSAHADVASDALKTLGVDVETITPSINELKIYGFMLENNIQLGEVLDCLAKDMKVKKFIHES